MDLESPVFETGRAKLRRGDKDQNNTELKKDDHLFLFHPRLSVATLKNLMRFWTGFWTLFPQSVGKLLQGYHSYN